MRVVGHKPIYFNLLSEDKGKLIADKLTADSFEFMSKEDKSDVSRETASAIFGDEDFLLELKNKNF